VARLPEPALGGVPQETARSPVAPGAGEGPRVASIPRGEGAGEGPQPGSGRAAPDIRSALRATPGGGGAGGQGRGWGGIEGEPIPLDSPDPRYNDYLDRVRRQIKANWAYPCLRNPGTRECEYRSATLVIAFGIQKTGRLQVVEVRASSGMSIYDDYAVNAIKLASPFPEVPAAMLRNGSGGLPILATFNYISETSLVNILR
jgi:TonB family protein